MYDTSGNTASGIIGYAADGFPIRGPYIEDNGTIRLIISGYLLKEGNRTSQEGEVNSLVVNGMVNLGMTSSGTRELVT